MMRYRTLTVLVGLTLLAQLSHGDEVILKNGDRLTGTIAHLVDGKLVFKSNMSGEVTVALTDIQTFSSDAPIRVNLKDSTSIEQKVLAAEPGRFTVEGSDALRPQVFAVDNIVSINPPVKPAPKWTGHLTGGLTSTHGNTKTEQVAASAKATKRTKKDRTLLSVDYAKGEQEDPDTGEDVTIEDWWRARGKYDYFLSKKMYAYLDGRYEKDAIASLDRRMIVGVGGGIQWIESDIMNFSTETGLASLYEKFDNQTDSNSELSAQLGYHFDRKLNSKTQFNHDLTYYPTIDKLSDYFLTSTAGVDVFLNTSFYLNLKVIFNYDTTPAIGAHSTDVKYFFGVGYNF